jgi:riboflavin synthase
MFTGLVEEVGECLWLRRSTSGTQLTLTARTVNRSIHTGDSVAINGCCLTLTAHRREQLVFDLLEETLQRTNLRNLRQGAPVNLERALRADARLGGHFVQGHVDAVGTILKAEDEGKDRKIVIRVPQEFMRYVAWKGSIAINGVSLTVGELSEDSLAVWIIPHTLKKTNLGALAENDPVNLEFDILAKYAERLLAPVLPKPVSENGE